MIRTEREFSRAKLQLANVGARLEEFRNSLGAEGYTLDEVEAGVSHLVSTQSELLRDITFYESAKSGDFDKLSRDGLGRLLIALRVSAGISQKELADRLGVSEAQVSRDERGEYFNVAFDRALRIAGVMGKELLPQVRDMDAGSSKELACV